MTILDKPGLSRRRFNNLVLGAVPALTVARPALAQSKDLRVVISAVYRKSFEGFIVPKMKELYNVNVIPSPFLSGEALTRAIAQRENPAISLFTLDQGPWLQGKEVGLWLTLDPKRAPNLENVFKNYRDPDGKGSALFSYLLGLLYDESAIKAANVEAPTSFFDMWKPEYKGRVTIPQFSSTFAFILLAETDRLLGGSLGGPFDKGFAKLRELRPNIASFVGPAGQYIQLFQQKEIWLTQGAHFTALQASRAGLPVVWKLPKEGAVAVAHYLGVPNNAPNLDETYKLIELMLSPEYQKQVAMIDFMGPVNGKTELDPAFAAGFPLTREAVESAAQVPWDAYGRDRIALGERWQREIQA
ncbi:ABC transporter substrate-binding protein [Bosea thiooxidans]|nr:extracellular solute-binding protein [Bosea sp. (in: a-proteobacteria)]